MLKYLEVARITLKAQIAYGFDTAIGVLLSFARILLAFILWSAVYKERSEIAGFTFAMMVTYYIIMSFFRRLDTTDSIVGQLSSEIREGQFTKYLVRPLSPLRYFAFSCFAKTLFILGINLAATVLFAAILKKYFILQTNARAVLCAALICFMGLSFLILFNYFIAVLSFKFIDVGAFNMIKNNIIEFLSGAMIPLAVLPLPLLAAMKYLPFYYIYYYPTVLLMNRGTEDVPAALAVLALWNVFMLAIVSLTYRSLRKEYEGVGV